MKTRLLIIIGIIIALGIAGIAIIEIYQGQIEWKEKEGCPLFCPKDDGPLVINITRGNPLVQITPELHNLNPTERDEPRGSTEVIKSITLHDVPYQELIENEQEYIGKMLYYMGKISNVDKHNSSGYLANISIIAVTPGAGWVDFIELSYTGSKLKDASFKKVWGMYKGINDDTGLPMFQVFIIE